MKTKTQNTHRFFGISRWLPLVAAGFTTCAPVYAYQYNISGTVVDTAGGHINQAKVSLQDDSTQYVMTDSSGSFHLSGSVTALRSIGTATGSGLQAHYGPRGVLYLDAPNAMRLTLSLTRLDGRTVQQTKSIKVTAGANRIENLVGNLPPGFYALNLRGSGVSLTMHLFQGGAATATAATNGSAGSASPLGKTAATAAVDPNTKPGLIVSKSGYAPMLHVPAADSESGVSVTLKKPLTHPGHIIVIYLENWSFDAMYGEFPGAEGLAQAASAQPQRDSTGTPYTVLPRPWNTTTNAADSVFPDTLPNKPFVISDYNPLNQDIPDLVHRFYQEQLQIDSGKMDQYAAVCDARGMTMGHWHTDSLPLAAYAHQYTLFDHFFHSAFGGSFLNHQWLISARTPAWLTIPTKYRAQVDSVTGKIIKLADRTYADGQATPDGYLINTIYTVNNPHPATAALDQLVPNLTTPTIGDRLNDKGISWAWYSGGWDSATIGDADSAFQFHHQPFAYYLNYADGTPGKAAHLKDESQFWGDLKAGTVPAVSFIKPVGVNNEHPGYTDLKTGELATKALIDSIKASSIWSDAAIIVTWDENGGIYDHVRPPMLDRWGVGTRIPALLISPYSKMGTVDHHMSETVSILSLIERRFGLVPLSARDAAAADLTTSLNLPN